MKSLKAKIVSTACSIGFVATLIGLAVSSYAWFSANKVTTGKGMNLKTEIDTNLINLDFKLYKYDFDMKEGVEYIEGTESFKLDLNDFDNFIRERNVYNNNVIRFNAYIPAAEGAEGGKRKLSLVANVPETTIGEKFNGGFTDRVNRTYVDNSGYKYHNDNDSKDYTCNNISNIIYFKALPYSYKIGDSITLWDENINFEGTLENPATADQIYKGATVEFGKHEKKSSFISSGSKGNLLTLDIVELDARATNVVFYIEYNYNIELIDAFLQNTEIVGAQDIGMMSSRIVFQKDIEKITIASQGVTE